MSFTFKSMWIKWTCLIEEKTFRRLGLTQICKVFEFEHMPARCV